MKILIINKNEKSGGAAQVCQELINEFELKGYKVNFFVKNKETTKQNTIKINNNKLKKLFSYITSNDLDYYYGDQILKTNEFKDADIINLHNISGHFFKLSTIIKMSKEKPVLWTFHDMHPINHYFAYSFSDKTKLGFFNGSSHNLFSNLIWWNKIYLKLRKKYIYNNSNFFIISPSAWLKNKIHKTKLKNKKIIIVNNGINKNIFQFKNIEEAKRLIGFNKNDKIILTIADGGKNNPRKGWKYIKKINNNLKKQNIKIISIGNKKEEIVDNIKFIKTIREPKQLEKYYQAADLLLFPTLADNFPMTSLESMACGTPVVAFDTGGIKEQIDHKINGYIAKYKDENDLLNGIKFIYSSDYEKMSKACRKKVEENFTSEIMAKKYIDLFYKAIQEYENRH